MNKAVEQPSWWCAPFEIVPGAGGSALLYWPAEKTWICKFPSRTVAHNFVIGSNAKFRQHAGWDRSSRPIDVAAALYRYRDKHGSFPQFEFGVGSDAFELYVKLDLGPELLARMLFHEADDLDLDHIAESVAAWGACVEKILQHASGKPPHEQITSEVTEMLLCASTREKPVQQLLARVLQEQLDYQQRVLTSSPL